MDIVSFLLERITEDETVARAVVEETFASDWEVGVYVSDDNIATVEPDIVKCGPTYYGGTERAAHLARHDPTRVLRECVAKRIIVSRCALVIESFERTANGLPGYVAWDDVNRREVQHARETLRAFAVVYDEHPDLDPKWVNDF